MTNDLLPCDFCGELPVITKHHKEEIYGLTHRCKVLGPISWEFSERDYIVKKWNTRTPNKSAHRECGVNPTGSEVDLDALKKPHKEWLPSNKKEQDICNLGWNRCIDWLYKNGHLATGRGGE